MKTVCRLFACLALLGLCTYSTGCAKDTGKDPSPLDLEPILDGQGLMLEPGNQVIIEKVNVSGFKVTETVMGPENQTATAVVTFNYRLDGSLYSVEGVISYQRTQSGEALNPRFETNSVELSG